MMRFVAIAVLAAGAAQAAPIELSTRERAAAFQAAGFRHWPQGWTRCLDDTGAAHVWARLEVADLNGDRLPEAWIRERSTCGREAVVLLTRRQAGWVVLLDEGGRAAELKTSRKGWPDLRVGKAAYRFDGTKYVRK